MLKLSLLIWLITQILSLCGPGPEAAVSTRPDRLTVDRVSVSSSSQDDSAGAWQLLLEGSHGDACEAAIISQIARYPSNIDLQLRRELPADAECAGEDARFQLQLPLTQKLTAGEPAWLIINDQVWRINYKGAGGLAFEQETLAAALIERAQLQGPEVDGGLRLQVLGSQALGCELPLLFSLRRTRDGVAIGVFNAIAADVACPAMVIEIDETVALPATELSGVALITVNQQPIAKAEEPDMSEIDKVLTNIHRVDITVMESHPMQIALEVAGEHPDGCEFPVKLSQSRRGNDVKVEVYREIPSDIFCPMILKPYQGRIHLEGKFDFGVYTISVNNHTQSIEL